VNDSKAARDEEATAMKNVLAACTQGQNLIVTLYGENSDKLIETYEILLLAHYKPPFKT